MAVVAHAAVPDPPLASVRVAARGLASSPEGALPALIVGVEPTIELAFSRLGEEVVDGRYLEDGDRLHAFIGDAMAGRLGVRTGSRMVLTAQTASGEIGGQLVRVAGNLPHRRRRAGRVAGAHPARHRPRLAGGGGRHRRRGAPDPTRAYTDPVLEEACVRHRWPRRGSRWWGGRSDAAGPVRGAQTGRRGRTGPSTSSSSSSWPWRSSTPSSYRCCTAGGRWGCCGPSGLSAGETGLVVYLEGILAHGRERDRGRGARPGRRVWLFFRDGLDLSGMMPEDINFGGIAFDPVMMPVVEARHIVQSACS